MLLLVLITHVVTIFGSDLRSQLISFNESLLPEFTDTPPSIVAIDSRVPNPVHIGCKAWPPFPLGRVTYFTATSSRLSPVPLHPVPAHLLDVNGSRIVLSSPEDVRRLTPYELYCIASTTFGSILSSPFKLVATNQTTTHLIPESRTAFVRCGPFGLPHGASIQFSLNDSILDLIPDKHLIVPSVQSPHFIEHVLLIRDFRQRDAGIYRCLTSDRTTTNQQNSSTTLLQVKQTSSGYTEYDDFSWVASHSHRTQVPKLVVTEGWNISLRCGFDEDDRHSDIRIVRENKLSLSPRHRFNSIFGVLFIDRLRTEDSGVYQCSIRNKTSPLFLQVKHKPHVRVHPPVLNPNSSDPLMISCFGSEPFPPIWYHNGRVMFSQFAFGSNSSIRLSGLTDSTVGVYQCVQRSLIGGWASDWALVTDRNGKLLRKIDFDQIVSYGFSAVRLPPSLVSVELGHVVTLSCWPDSFAPDVLDQLWKFFPGSSSRLIDRLLLALTLRHARVGWLKDGIQLSLSSDASGKQPYQFNLTVAHSHDYGFYECVVHTGIPLFFYGTDVQSSSMASHKSDHMFDHVTPYNGLPHAALPSTENGTDRGKRNAPVPFSSTLLLPERSAEEDDQDSWFNSVDIPSTNRIAPRIQTDFFDHSNLRSIRPTGSSIGDNLAVNVTWPAVEVEFYRLQLRHKLPEDWRWSKPLLANGLVHECCTHTPNCCRQTRHYYFTNRQPDVLEPGQLYQFRVLFVVTNNVPQIKSRWSPTVSFEHISPIAPVISETERLSDGSVLARWTLHSSALGFPIDHFLLLYRMEVVRHSGGKIAYNPFQHVLVPGAETREYVLSNLEPDKGYQLVVYGVHTPPGLDSHSTVFQGGIGGRKITLFSHEVFVQPHISEAVTSSLMDPGQSSYLDSIVRSRKSHQDNDMVYNSDESNRRMFLILGALAGLMLIVMISLLILCVCRQMRKNSRAEYHRAIKRQTNSWMMERDQLDRGKFESRPPTFMLENLTKVTGTSSTIASSQKVPSACRSTARTSLIYSQPPPFCAPPPPAHGMETRYLISDNLTSSVQHPIMIQQQSCVPQRAPSVMMQSQSPELHGSLLYSNNGTLVANSLPFGMKREPPSGGSVHGGTDNENDVLETGPVATTSLSGPLGTATMAHDQLLISRPMEVYHNERLRSPNQYFINPVMHHQWSHHYGQVPLMAAYPPNMATFQVSESSNFGSLGYRCTPVYREHGSGNHFVDHGHQPVVDCSSGRCEWHPIAPIPEHHRMLRMPHSGPQIPVEHSINHWNVAAPSGLNSRPDFMSHDLRDDSHLPAPGKQCRRRQLTAENHYNRHQQPTDFCPGQPLMASSPVWNSVQTFAVTQHVQSFPEGVHSPIKEYPADRVMASPERAPEYPMSHFNPACVPYLRHSSMTHAHSPYDHDCTQGPDISMHHNAFGPLNYGQYNPIASGPRNILATNDPPRVRDYSEYGIPIIHGRQVPTDDKPSEPTSVRERLSTVNNDTQEQDLGDQKSP